MKARSGKASLITSAVLLIIGGGLIYGNTFDRELGVRISEWIATPVGSLILGGVMVASVVLGWLTHLFGKKKKDRFINFQSDDGSVGISTKAIQDFIERVGKEFAGVKSIDSELIEQKSSLDIAVSVKVVSGNKIPELSAVLQQRIRESVRESLGLDEIRNITIQVSEIVGEPAKPIEETPEET